MSNPLLDTLTQEAAIDGIIDVFLDVDALRRDIGAAFDADETRYIEEAFADITLITGLEFNFVETEGYSELSFHKIDVDHGGLEGWGVEEGAVGLATPSREKDHNVIYFEEVVDEALQEAVMYHEIGHVFGLEHSSDPAVMMSQSIMSYNLDEFLGFTADDVMAFNEIW